MLYRNLSSYLRKKYGKRLSKICIDAGFTCPNRDGKCGTGGCIFCGERGAGEHIDATKSIDEQLKSALSRARDDEEFIAYFQNFTNTYADIKTLKERYDAALISDKIRILSVGTRPDCIDEDVAELLAGYSHEREVWVELGLQTANDDTAKAINRGYTRERFESAVEILTRHGIKIVVHIIIGLPNESFNDVKSTAEYLARFPIFGLKIHSLYVMRGTRLSEMYEQGEYFPISLEEYTERAACVLAHTSPDVVIHRLTGDCPRDLLIAPKWNSDKHNTIAKIEEVLARDKLKQGALYVI